MGEDQYRPSGGVLKPERPQNSAPSGGASFLGGVLGGRPRAKVHQGAEPTLSCGIAEDKISNPLTIIIKKISPVHRLKKIGVYQEPVPV